MILYSLEFLGLLLEHKLSKCRNGRKILRLQEMLEYNILKQSKKNTRIWGENFQEVRLHVRFSQKIHMDWGIP